MNETLLAISGSVILMLLGIVSYFGSRILNKQEKIYDSYIKFFGENGEKDTIWDRLDTLTRDAEWTEYTIKQNMENIPAKRKIHRHKIDR